MFVIVLYLTFVKLILYLYFALYQWLKLTLCLSCSNLITSAVFHLLASFVRPGAVCKSSVSRLASSDKVMDYVDFKITP